MVSRYVELGKILNGKDLMRAMEIVVEHRRSQRASVEMIKQEVILPNMDRITEVMGRQDPLFLSVIVENKFRLELERRRWDVQAA